MQNNEIVTWDAVTLSRRIHARDVSCAEVMQAFLRQVDHLNPTVNAVVARVPEATLMAAANALDGALRDGRDLGPLHGFPQAPKDALPVQGLVTSKGSPIFRENVSATDSAAFQRMREGGCLFIGRTNAPEFCLGGNTVNSVYGATVNPFDTARSAGGSSGGAAVAVALNMLPVADGTDMMGSLRTPAAFNQVYGLRPSVGCVPHGPTEDVFFQQFSVSGPMARQVADLALLLSVQAGFDARLPLTRRQDDPSRFMAALERDHRGTRVAWLGDLGGRLPMDAGLMAVCEQALPWFDAVGVEVAGAGLAVDWDEVWAAWIDLRSFTIAGNSASLYRNPETRALLKADAIWEIERGLSLTAERIFQASTVRSRLYQTVLALFDDYDFLVLPAAQVFPFPVGEAWPAAINGQAMDTYHRWMEVALIPTLCGLPALSVPAGCGPAGLPAGLQIVARPQADVDVLQLGHAYDLASRFSLTRSPLLG